MSDSHEFAIAGAGIAGLATACALAPAGHAITIYEQAEKIEEVGAGLQIGPNAVRALKQLKVWNTLEPATVAPGHIAIRNGNTGRMLSNPKLGESFERHYGDAYRVAHRADLLAALLKVADSYSNVTIRTATTISGFTQDDRSVTLSFDNRQQDTCDALIGADGIRSTVRAGMLSNATPRFTGHVIYRALLSTVDVPSCIDQSAVGLWLGPGGHVVHYPVSGGRSLNLVCAVDGTWQDDGWSCLAPPQEVLDNVPGHAADLRELLATPSSWLKWAGADLEPMTNWSDGNVALIGDAAHASLPFLAQGAAMALEDAVVLANCVEQELDLPSAFTSYARIRHPRTARQTLTARQMGRVYHLPQGSAFFRNAALQFLPAGLPTSRLSWLYNWSVK